ncbi:hypothetical protein GUJ93_ZPchr0008g13084 [Zizania palustris]|uniref:Secreted protein n=1 Tax=Zizania palustris TaxID=103762 RepID=A0A8J5RBM7_ZIZPA|nr:hypothetical protein GUJ93_ZPchr0008g13084 [Zizania palustris]
MPMRVRKQMRLCGKGVMMTAFLFWRLPLGQAGRAVTPKPLPEPLYVLLGSITAAGRSVPVSTPHRASCLHANPSSSHGDEVEGRGRETRGAGDKPSPNPTSASPTYRRRAARGPYTGSAAPSRPAPLRGGGGCRRAPRCG